MIRIFKGLLLLSFMISVFNVHGQEAKYSELMTQTAMRLWPDAFTLEKDQPAKWSYDLGVILKGVEGVWKNTANKRYFDYIQHKMDHYVQEDGTINAYKMEDYNIDFINNGKILLFLYQVTGKEKYLKAVQHLRKQLDTHPRTKQGSFWHKKIYTHQVWLDGLYMGQPFYAEYAKLFNEPEAFDDISRQFVLIEKNTRDEKTGLLYHGWDESKEQQWADKETGRSPHFWSRALGWYGMAMVDVLDHFPKTHPGRDSIIAILNRYANAITKFQQANGLWYQVTDLPERKGNYPEASASSMMVYTLAKGVRLGYLPAKFLKNAEKGYAGILEEFIEKDAQGNVNLNGTVKVSGLGGKPYRDGSFDYYMSEPVIQNDPKGIGAFIQCAVEMEMVPNLQFAKGKKVLLDYYYNRETRKNILSQQERYHYTWEEQDNGGYSLLGYIFRSYGALTDSLPVKPTEENLRNADVYIIVDPDTEKESANPHFLEATEIDVITKWVKKGGTLVLLGNDAGNAEFTHFNELARRFGVQFNEDNHLMVKRDQFEQGAVFTDKANPIFKNPYKLYIKEVSSLRVYAPATPIVGVKGLNVMAISKYGKGKVFALGDPWIYNEYLDGRKLPAEYQNFAAAHDWVKWLLK
ncbi:glycoside hydrolase family 88 protein [Olivibacter sp. XZL3]|uniref:glycoside hydrolase family 88 protein n=1 Tax=Olivibacter sp. XZL3 TaxID=1735116 RepID=UPI001065D392|nr:glycoside hydrolase family 88 protein [Olivibacter sp. XZL3]